MTLLDRHLIFYYCFIVLGALCTEHVLGAKEHVSIQFSSVAQSCSTLCYSMDCCMPGFPVHHQLPKLAQTHGPWIGDAIWPSHSLSSPSPPAFNLSRHQGLFQWVSSLHHVAKILTKDLIDRVLGELWIEVCDIIQEAVIKTIPKKKK